MEVNTASNTWNEFSIKNIKLAETSIMRSKKLKDINSRYNSLTLPSLKEDSSIIRQYYTRIQADIRSTQTVISKLTDTLLIVDEEIKSLLRLKENLEKVFNHTRKYILLNEQSSKIRKMRPQNEKEKDAADDLLFYEKKSLLKTKKLLEAQLTSIQIQLQTLDNARKQSNKVISECTLALDIISRGQTLTGLKKSEKKDECNTVSVTKGLNNVGAYISEATLIIKMCYDAVKNSQTLKHAVENIIEQTRALQKDLHSGVNASLSKKITESTLKKQHLQLLNGKNLIALHHDSRCQFMTDIAKGYSLGPVSLMDLTASERRCSPIYKNKSTGLLTETKQLTEKNAALENYLEGISKNVEMLKNTHQRLKNEIRDKQAALQVDASVVRYRRRKADH